MHTTQEYIDQLEKDKYELVKNLTAMGVPCFSSTDTFTSLASKVMEIPFMIYEGWKDDLDLRDFDLPKQAIITMFQRLANVKEDFATHTIELGDNISKLQLDEMRIASDKGWKIY